MLASTENSDSTRTVGERKNATLIRKGKTMKTIQVIPKADIEIEVPDGPNNNRIFDITRAREDFGYSPKFLLKEGVEDYLDTLKKLKCDIPY